MSELPKTMKAIKNVGVGKAEVQEALKGTFRKLYGGTDGALTDAELATATERIRTKFDTQEWLHRVP